MLVITKKGMLALKLLQQNQYRATNGRKTTVVHIAVVVVVAAAVKYVVFF